jgi:L-alanine-DL-glutamate epimerase-like enolase superfamily enzyme
VGGFPDRLEARVLEAAVEFFERPFRKPLQISSGSITRITEARVRVTLVCNGREATGRGSVYLSGLWAWPDVSLSHREQDWRLRRQCERIAAGLRGLTGEEAAHPLELGLRLHRSVCRETAAMPALALAMCASPFDAAIHDGCGQALGISAFRFYDRDVPLPEADAVLEGGACRAIRALLRPPVSRLPAWLIVSRGDDLERDVRPWVRARGYRCFKVKVLGRSNADDAGRTSEVFRAARRFGAERPRLSVDSNEANPDARSVLEYLEMLRARDAEAYDALEYLEQPTSRDIRAHPVDWTAVARRKPVLLDEGLTSFESLQLAREQGWSGLALKTCKGHSFALVAAAWARRRGMLLSLQDLTNPGYSAIHAALLAAHVDFINGLELNSPQYTPDANAEWLPRLEGLFRPRNGEHRLDGCWPPGLGGAL